MSHTARPGRREARPARAWSIWRVTSAIGRHAVDRHTLALLLVIFEQRRRVLVIDREAVLERFRRVVGARGAARLLDALFARWRGTVVDLELDHEIDLLAALGEHPVERFGLRDGAREAVEHRAFAQSGWS